jgi:hypothetical protein
VIGIVTAVAMPSIAKALKVRKLRQPPPTRRGRRPRHRIVARWSDAAHLVVDSVAPVIRRPSFVAWSLAVVLAAAGCASPTTSTTAPGTTPASASPTTGPTPTATPRATFPPAPVAPAGPLDPTVGAAVDAFLDSILSASFDQDALDVVAASGDPRIGWLISDLLRFLQGSLAQDPLVDAFGELTGVDPRDDPAFAASPWRSITDSLLAWDLPAPPEYRERKARLFLEVEPGWTPFFTDVDSTIDWRLLSWGGVLIDDRPLGDKAPCPDGCIPALDDPALTPASEGGWYPDERFVFGLEVDGEAVALPRNIMEVHEMVNMTVGGRRLGVPYCTLCGSAQAYFTDAVPDGVEVPVLRTSGLLSRSNKVMYDLLTGSVFDTFTGEARSGPLQERGLVLEQATVVVSRWGDWKASHPATRIIARDGGLGRTYPEDPLRGRDDDGPIFPIGDVDPRLPVQASVLGVIGPDGTVVAFPAEQARDALAEGRAVTLGDIELVADGGGLRARLLGGGELASHQAFWFAWSQFYPDTVVWTPLSR